MTKMVSFWIMIFSAIIGLIVGSFTHWIVGVIVFFLFWGKTALLGLVMDTISGSLKYHHDRMDSRKSREYQSDLYLQKRALELGRPDLVPHRFKTKP